jgi:hypothetical protein
LEVLKRLVLNAEGTSFFKRLSTLIQLGSVPPVTESHKEVSQQIIAWLKQLIQDDPLSAIRYRRFLPPEKSPLNDSVGDAPK